METLTASMRVSLVEWGCYFYYPDIGGVWHGLAAPANCLDCGKRTERQNVDRRPKPELLATGGTTSPPPPVSVEPIKRHRFLLTRNSPR